MIKSMKILVSTLLVIVFTANWSNSQVTMRGGRGLHRILSAEVVAPADIYLNSYFSMYFIKTGPERMAKYYSFYLNGTVGLSKYFEMSCQLIPYQDDQQHLFGQFGDSQIGIKYMLPFSGPVVQLGLQGYFRLPTANVSNVNYEVFSTKNPGWGLNSLLNFDFSNMITSFPFKLMLNYGYIDHDIYDTYFTSKIDQMFVGTGMIFSIRSTQLYLEYTGEIFMNNADSVDYNVNSQRITTGTRFLGPWKIAIDLAGDFSLAKCPKKLLNKDIFHKEYANWRLWVGVTYRFSVYKYFDKSAKIAKKKQTEEIKKLERIETTRKKASEEMEKMKELLDKKAPKEEK
jgi:hypothetical protein